MIMILPSHVADEDTKRWSFESLSHAMTVIVFKPTNQLRLITNLIRMFHLREDMVCVSNFNFKPYLTSPDVTGYAVDSTPDAWTQQVNCTLIWLLFTQLGFRSVYIVSRIRCIHGFVMVMD